MGEPQLLASVEMTLGLTLREADQPLETFEQKADAIRSEVCTEHLSRGLTSKKTEAICQDRWPVKSQRTWPGIKDLPDPVTAKSLEIFSATFKSRNAS